MILLSIANYSDKHRTWIKIAAPWDRGRPARKFLAMPRPKAAGETPAVPGAIVTIISETQ
jgi:hypothetical protein